MMIRVALALAAIVTLGACGDDPDDVTVDDGSVPRTTDTDRTTPGLSEKQAAGQDTSAPNEQPRRHVRRFLVLDVIDGDTVEVAYRGGVSVRVIGIDTPETVDPNEPVECGGPEASATAERLLNGKRVRLVFDPSQGRTDSYGRTLAYLGVPNVGDFGLAMIKRGRAAEYTYDTAYQRQARYLAAETLARQADRGLWGRCGGVDVPLHRPTTPHEPRDGGGDCEAGYDPCVPSYPPDVDCDDVDGPIQVIGDDPHGLDGYDDDGIGCE
jgi:endonuclease YncB( thermonuclease family)